MLTALQPNQAAPEHPLSQSQRAALARTEPILSPSLAWKGLGEVVHTSHSNTSAYHSHYKMQHDHEGEYDEDRGGPRNANNYLSFTTAGVIFKASRAGVKNA